MDIKNVNVVLNLRLTDKTVEKISKSMLLAYCEKILDNLPEKYGAMTLDFAKLNYLKINEPENEKEE